MNRKELRKMIIAECGCMAREGDLPAAIGSALPMLDILGYGGGDERVAMTGQHDDDMGIEYEDSDNYEESSMIRNNLYKVAEQSAALHDAIEDGDDLPEWVQEKIAVASEMMDVVYDYLYAEMAHSDDMHEGKKPWYMKKRKNMKKTNESEWYDIPKKKKPVKKK